MSRRWFAVLIAIACTYGSATWLQRYPIATIAPLSLPAPESHILRWWALGYPQLVADSFWLAAIHHFGDGRMHARNYPELVPLMERVIQLDPYFAAAYQFIGTAMTLKDMPIAKPLAWLALGTALRPDQWKIPFLWGFNLYYFEQDNLLAAKALALAAKHPQAPEHLGLLAGRLAAQAGEPATGLALIETLLHHAQNEQSKQALQERYQQLLHEYHRDQLQQAARQFAAQSQAPLQQLQQLVQAKLLPAIPEEPLGGVWLVSRGQIESSSEQLRLRPAQGTTAGAAAKIESNDHLQSTDSLPKLEQ